MKHVKWIFVVLLICSLTAFVEKDKPPVGLSFSTKEVKELISNTTKIHFTCFM